MKRARAAKFTTQLARLDYGMRHFIVPIPDAIGAAWKAAKVRRLIGTLNGHPIDRSLQVHPEGGYFIMIGRAALSQMGLKRGTPVKAVLRPDPQPDVVTIPEELSIALEQDTEARARWATFTPGFQRSLAYYVTSAKQEPTRIKRAIELAQKIRTRSLHSDKQRPR